jgi:hypothetical protein
LHGTFIAALVRGNHAKWFYDCSNITSKYRPDRMKWTLEESVLRKIASIVRVAPK